MTEPKTVATAIHHIRPWLLHWKIADERIGSGRSNAFAVDDPAGLVIIDPLPLTSELEAEFKGVAAILLTNGNHQRSAWRLRRMHSVPVFIPAGTTGLDEEADEYYDEGNNLPERFSALRAQGFANAGYPIYTPVGDSTVVFCGDLICHDPGGPYRFPIQPGYFDPEKGKLDAQRLAALPIEIMCAAHGIPATEGCQQIFESLAE